ncbi:MAG: hypothetical protein M3P91_05430 [Actinomycetota bacterium]|nr:hypothetical protein [Actinomycetota bacterium]
MSNSTACRPALLALLVCCPALVVLLVLLVCWPAPLAMPSANAVTWR